MKLQHYFSQKPGTPYRSRFAILRDDGSVEVDTCSVRTARAFAKQLGYRFPKIDTNRISIVTLSKPKHSTKRHYDLQSEGE